MTQPVTRSCDCAVIGGGPGGLSAAMYLARFNRQVLLFDSGRPRACWSPRNRNYPGFPDGISGEDLVELFKRQAREFHVPCTPEWVTEICKGGAGFCVQAGGEAIEARTVILATGVQDKWPDVANIEALKGTRIRTCPICDAYEVNGRTVGLMGSGDKVAREALYLTTFTCRVTLFTVGLRQESPIDPKLCERLGAEEVAVLDACLTRLDPVGEEGVRVTLDDGGTVEVDMLFTALGCGPNNELALKLGADTDSQGYVKTSGSQETSVPGLYAIGDISTDINQISVAVGQAAIAACAVHNSLLDF